MIVLLIINVIYIVLYIQIIIKSFVYLHKYKNTYKYMNNEQNIKNELINILKNTKDYVTSSGKQYKHVPANLNELKKIIKNHSMSKTTSLFYINNKDGINLLKYNDVRTMIYNQLINNFNIKFINTPNNSDNINYIKKSNNKYIITMYFIFTFIPFYITPNAIIQIANQIEIKITNNKYLNITNNYYNDINENILNKSLYEYIKKFNDKKYNVKQNNIDNLLNNIWTNITMCIYPTNITVNDNKLSIPRLYDISNKNIDDITQEQKFKYYTECQVISCPINTQDVNISLTYDNVNYSLAMIIYLISKKINWGNLHPNIDVYIKNMEYSNWINIYKNLFLCHPILSKLEYPLCVNMPICIMTDYIYFIKECQRLDSDDEKYISHNDINVGCLDGNILSIYNYTYKIIYYKIEYNNNIIIYGKAVNINNDIYDIYLNISNPV